MVKAKSKPRKPKQQHFNGMEPPSVPKIDRLADRYVEHRDARMEALREEIDAADLLFAAMKEEGLSRYEYGDRVVELRAAEKVKVSRKKELVEVSDV